MPVRTCTHSRLIKATHAQWACLYQGPACPSIRIFTVCLFNGSLTHFAHVMSLNSVVMVSHCCMYSVRTSVMHLCIYEYKESTPFFSKVAFGSFCIQFSLEIVCILIFLNTKCKYILFFFYLSVKFKFFFIIIIVIFIFLSLWLFTICSKGLFVLWRSNVFIQRKSFVLFLLFMSNKQ